MDFSRDGDIKLPLGKSNTLLSYKKRTFYGSDKRHLFEMIFGSDAVTKRPARSGRPGRSFLHQLFVLFSPEALFRDRD